MPVHSRPHLTTHNRSQGHSAVAAAAYRLGLRLLDRRTGIWHDYTKRSVGEEVVAAMTIAPEGSPSWVEDPDELWNRVEECEKRRDAQVARDYVIPVPLGLDDARATELARRLARYISDNLGTPVSIGIHRDADVDLFGNPKPKEQQGYHAHLLFPTRRILFDGDSGTDEAARQGFGAKLSVLSNRRTSAGIVEAMNREWSNLSNELVAEVGLRADYDWRSYERLGIDRVPRPRLTQKEVALEKKGFFTKKGDVLRDIMLMSEVYKQAHTEALAAQQEMAQADVIRERSAPDIAPAPMADAVGMPEMAVQSDEVTAPDLASLKIELAGARERGRLPHSSLADRFVAHSAVPTDEEGRQVLFSLSGLVWSVQKALRSLGVVLARLAGHQDQIRRVAAGDLDVAYQIDEARRRRGAADTKIEAYKKAHPWEVFAKRTFGQGEHGVPRRLRDLQHDRESQQRQVDDLKWSRKVTADQLAALRVEERQLGEEEARHRGRLERAVGEFMALEPKAAPALLAVLPDEHRVQVEAVMGPNHSGRAPAAITMERPRLALDIPRPRPH